MMDDVSSVSPVTILIKSTGNVTGNILAVNIICTSVGYLIFKYFYVFWVKLVDTWSLMKYNILYDVSISS